VTPLYNQRTTNNEQRTTNNEQRTTNNEQRTTNNEQRTTNKEFAMVLKEGSRGDTVKSTQDMLTKLGYKPGPADGIFGDKTEQAVINFQENEGLYGDGIVGPMTMAALEQAIARLNIELNSPGPDAADGLEERIPFVRVDADPYGEGYDRLFLRADVAEAYNRVRKVVTKAGGLLTSSGGRRTLSAPVNSNRSATSFHYLGRALDLFVGSGMENPKKDPFVVTPLEDRRFRVYVRVKKGDEMELDAVTYAKRNKPTKVTGKFLDLTELFDKEGFKSIRARRSFFQGGSWLGAEWWHFQYEKDLVPGVSTFGGELLRVYAERTLKNTPPWLYRERIFKVNWG
jgi:peptidoglycan hydrolase-like protein with peptidoglycan-binding domain